MKNSYQHNQNGTTTIYVKRQGEDFPVKIDTADFEKVNAFPNTWKLQWDKKARTHYVAGFLKGKKVYLHRWITDAPTGKVVDHFATHDGCDNRRSNLRVCTYKENNQNRRDESEPFGNPQGKTKFILHSSKKGEKVYWGVSYVHGIYLGRYEDYADALAVQSIGNFVVSDWTDEKIIECFLALGHKEEYVKRLITHIRKVFNRPDPFKK